MSLRLPTPPAVLALVATLVLVGLLHTARAQGGFVNQFRQPFTFECPSGEALQRVTSVPAGPDRQWRFSCAPFAYRASLDSCEWSNFVNDWRGPADFQCPADHVITGMESVYSDGSGDRRWKLKCCRDPSYRTVFCTTTDFLNDFRGLLNYWVPSARVLVGWHSAYDDSYMDRRYAATVCAVRR